MVSTNVQLSLVSAAGDAVWWLLQRLLGGRRALSAALPNWASATPTGSPVPQLPPLGLPRAAESLCPACNRRAVEAVVDGRAEVAAFRADPGIIDAQILEESGRVVMRKTCALHGAYEDVLSTDAAFFNRIESLHTTSDFGCSADEGLHDHGPLSIKSGRGLALIVDLTNRCNLKCSPCFMDANHSPYVHELTMSDVARIFARTRSFKPQRDFNILFAGGEPTIAHHFLDAVSHAKGVGFKRICVVTNGLRFAQEPDFARRTAAAGVHQVYLQLDGPSNASHFHRGAKNLFDVKTEALLNIAGAGMMTNLQVAVTKGINNQHVGDVVRFAVENVDKVRSVLFQPIMFAGRDADVSDEVRRARRYTLADLAHDLKAQAPGMNWEPMRDWFPMSAYGVFGSFFDALNPSATVGSIFSAVHPDQGMFSPLLVDQQSKRAMPISSFLNIEQLLKDVAAITSCGCSPALAKAQLAATVLRNYDQRRAPVGFAVSDLTKLFGHLGPRFSSVGREWSARDNSDPRWRLVMIAAMWFQDVFNFDLSAVQMDATPVATAEGEIAFSAYNAAGWRQVVEHLHKTATLADWHRLHGRHRIYANGAFVPTSALRRVKQPDSVAALVVGSEAPVSPTASTHPTTG